MKCNHEYAEIYTGIASTVFECIHCEHQIDNDTYYKLLDMQSHLRLLAEAVLEAHQISPHCEYCVRNDAPSCSVDQCGEIGCQCPACKLAREVMG